MNLQLEGKQALVTGSTAGIGFAIAEGLAKEGASVIVNGRTVQRVDDAVRRLREAGFGGRVEGLAADLATAGGAQAAISRFPDRTFSSTISASSNQKRLKKPPTTIGGVSSK